MCYAEYLGADHEASYGMLLNEKAAFLDLANLPTGEIWNDDLDDPIEEFSNELPPTRTAESPDPDNPTVKFSNELSTISTAESSDPDNPIGGFSNELSTTRTTDSPIDPVDASAEITKGLSTTRTAKTPFDLGNRTVGFSTVLSTTRTAESFFDLNCPIVEIMEIILNHLSLQDLFICQQVSQVWKEIIETSPSLKTAMFLRPGGPMAVNPILRDLFPDLVVDMSECRNELTGIKTGDCLREVTIRNHWRQWNQTVADQLQSNLEPKEAVGDNVPYLQMDKYTRSNASWRKMLAVQPPLKCIHQFCYNPSPWGRPRAVSTIRYTEADSYEEIRGVPTNLPFGIFGEGLTLGELEDLLVSGSRHTLSYITPMVSMGHWIYVEMDAEEIMGKLEGFLTIQLPCDQMTLFSQRNLSSPEL